MTGTETGSGTIIDKSFAELSTSELYAILRLRCDVFVVEQNCAYPELDGRDTEPATRHLWIEADDGIAAYARLLAEGAARVRVGRVVTAEDHRGEGLAKVLVMHLVATNPERTIVIDAQSYLVAWYQRLGFAPTGPQFVEDGIRHVPMALSPTA